MISKFGVSHSDNNNDCPDGTESIFGTATPQNGDNARLSLQFNVPSIGKYFAKGNYYVTYVEEGKDGKYDWLLSVNPCRDNVYVITRDAKVDLDKVKSLINMAKDLGVDISGATYRAC